MPPRGWQLVTALMVLGAVLRAGAFTAQHDSSSPQWHAHGFRLELKDFIGISNPPASTADDLSHSGVRSGRPPQALVQSGWTPRLLTEYGFGPGHEEFDMIVDHAKHLVWRHLRGDPGIAEGDRMELKPGVLDSIDSLAKTVQGHMAAGRARGSAGLSDEEHIAHAGSRLALSLALQLKEETQSDGVCDEEKEDSEYQDDIGVLNQVDESSETATEAGSAASLAALEELGSAAGEKGDGAVADGGDLPSRVWTVGEGGLTEWEPLHYWHACHSEPLTDRKAESFLEGSSLAREQVVIPAVKHFNDHIFARFQLATACPCKLRGEVQQWRAEAMTSRGAERTLASQLDLVCFRASDHLCSGPSPPFGGKKWCSCYHRPLLLQSGVRAGWLSREGLEAAGLNLAGDLGCDRVLSNPTPAPPPSRTQPAHFWKICQRQSCFAGAGIKCEAGGDEDVIKEGLMSLKERIAGLAPDCRCNAARPPKYATLIHRSRGVVCFKATGYGSECPEISKEGMCLCVTRAGLAVPKHSLSRWGRDFVGELACGGFFDEAKDEVKGVEYVKSIKAEMKAAFAEYRSTVKARTKSLLDAASAVGSLFKFKWASKLFGFPDFSQSLSLKAICSPAGNCLRYIASFSAQIVAFVFSFLADIVRVVLIAIKALLSLSSAGRAVMDSVGNTMRGGRALVKSIAENLGRRESDSSRLARLGAFSTDPTIFANLQEDKMRLELSKSLVPGTEAEDASAACAECSAEIEISAGVPLGPIPNPFKLGVDIGFSPQAAPSLIALTLGRMKTCRKCQKASRWFMPPGQDQSYAKAFAASCNPITVGLCTILSTQRQLRIDDPGIDAKRFPWDGFFFQSSKGSGIKDRRNKKDMDGQRFCKMFESNVFVDLYRASNEGSELFTDIQCGTPAGTPTPGMVLGDICAKVEKLIEGKDDGASCWFKPKTKPYDYLPECMELMQCSPYNGLDNEEEIMKEANQVALDKMEGRLKSILMEAQLHYNKRQESHLDEFRRLLHELSATSEEEFAEGQLRMVKAQVEATWKHSAAMLFTDYRWARPECLNVRANSEPELEKFIMQKRSDLGSSPRHVFVELHKQFLDVSSQNGLGPNGDGQMEIRLASSAAHCADMTADSLPVATGTPLFFQYVWCVLQTYRRGAISAMGEEGERYVREELTREERGRVQAAGLMARASEMMRQASDREA